jgi:lycopene cyclase domain-containing protein
MLYQGQTGLDMIDFGRYTYMVLMGITFLLPIALSFDRRVHFYTRWKALFPSILPMFIVFIIWDVIFTRNNVWWFNKDYVIGWFIAHLPIEEWLFFILVPFACVFIYDVLKHYFRIKPSNTGLYINILLIAVLFVLLIIYHDRTYTSVNFITAILTILIQFILKSHKTYLNLFYVSYLVCLIPFFIVNGVLTSLPVVGYNNDENLALRVFTIPVEDFIYLYTLLLMTITFYEFFLKKFKIS